MTSTTGKTAALAVHGGTPVRSTLLPYGRHCVDEADITAVTGVLRAGWLTTGPKIGEFEQALAGVTGAPEVVVFSNGTAALHAALHALRIGPGDEVVVPSMTFASTANAAAFLGAKPVFADVDPDTLLLTAAQAEAALTPKTKAIVAVDYAGQPCAYEPLAELARRRGVALVADACHSLGGAERGKPVGALAPLSCFSFHPVKGITTGEGGAVAVANIEHAAALRRFRGHGITSDHRERSEKGTWHYEMAELGYNYRICDIQCALGLSQLAKLPGWIERRNAIAKRYDEAFAKLPAVSPLKRRAGVTHAYHLYVIRLELERLHADRSEIFRALRAEGIGCNVHYIPVHLHPYYRKTHGTREGLCPNAEAAYARILSLPIFPAMTDRDVEDTIVAVEKVVEAYAA